MKLKDRNGKSSMFYFTIKSYFQKIYTFKTGEIQGKGLAGRTDILRRVNWEEAHSPKG